MTPIGMIALDLDDTLLRSDLSISYRTKHVIKRAEAAGMVVVLVSSRIPAAMKGFVRFLGMHKRPGYLICNNGTIIQESNTGTIIHEIRIPSESALIAFDLAHAEGFSVQLYENDIMYVSRSNEFVDYDQKLTGLRQVVVENFRDMVSAGCHKLRIPGDPMILAPLESLLRTYVGEEVNLFTSKPYFLEILPPHTDKGTALETIAKQQGIPRERVLAIGDSMNDEGMIRWAGLGVAMINGDERIKDLAAIVTERSNDDDGVADIIERYVLRRSS
ncbi:MAG: Cof-type HAD-IIB family hydrolase [Treponema sp.]|jgi:Cof subfamily protein (haloacid dehalogenase superfamily)|nr:Cof-type HAD-IIB family hydrolase [Treponema sp.]